MIYFHIDGASINNKINNGIGGWGVVKIDEDGTISKFSGSERNTTNNRMEMWAAIEALNSVPYNTDITIWSDSQYLVCTMEKGWRKRKNKDLWDKIDELCRDRQVKFLWERGHAGNYYNEVADSLAQRAAESERWKIIYETKNDAR